MRELGQQHQTPLGSLAISYGTISLAEVATILAGADAVLNAAFAAEASANARRPRKAPVVTVRSASQGSIWVDLAVASPDVLNVAANLATASLGTTSLIRSAKRLRERTDDPRVVAEEDGPAPAPPRQHPAPDRRLAAARRDAELDALVASLAESAMRAGIDVSFQSDYGTVTFRGRTSQFTSPIG